MTFTQAVRSAFNQYAGFTGRARRSEYWWWLVFTVLVGMAAAVIDQALGTTVGGGLGQTGIIGSLVGLALLLPTLAVAVRRLHDTGRTAWWLLISLVPFGVIVLIVFLVQDSAPGADQHGPNPKETGHPSATRPG